LKTGAIEMTEYETDVVVVGGGAQGLWALNELRDANYSVVLLEREQLGCQQTGHAQVYLHRGYVRAKAKWIEYYKAIWPHWETWLQQRGVEIGERRSIFGLINQDKSISRLWKATGLNFDRNCAIPGVLKGGVIKRCMASPEIAIDGSWLLSELAGKGDSILKVAELVSVVAENNTHGAQVVAKLSDGQMVKLKCRAILFCAGLENNGLLDRWFPGSPTQPEKDAHVLVIRGSNQVLPELCGVFPHNNFLFVVNRRLNDENIWLVSDDAAWKGKAEPEWIAEVLKSLAKVAPTVMSQQDRLQWGIYKGRKAEFFSEESQDPEWVPPLDYGIVKIANRPVWVAWPARLTAVPLVAKQILVAIQQQLVAQGIPQPKIRNNPHKCQLAPERWTTTNMESWTQFQRSWA
jgi:hypothetical protein